MASPELRILSLCSGVGWLDEGVRAGAELLGLRARAVGYVERDAYAAACLLARMADSSLEPAPVWCGDLRELDGRELRGQVDLVVAGLPCQPYSVAGKQRGNSDARSHGENSKGPIPHFLRIVSECRPSLVFLENVPPWIRGGWFRPVGDELCRMGFTIELPLFVTAKSVGASHRRERAFVLAHAVGDGQRSGRYVDAGNDGNLAGPAVEFVVGDPERARTNTKPTRSRSRNPTCESGEPVADPEFIISGNEESGRRTDWRGVAGRPGADVAPPECSRPQGDRPSEQKRRSELESCDRDRGIFAPGPAADWSEISPHLWPAVEPGLCVRTDGRDMVVDASRADQLRCAGNGCVPLCASVAFVELMRRVKT